MIAPFASSVSCGKERQATRQVGLPDWAVEPLFPRSGVPTDRKDCFGRGVQNRWHKRSTNQEYKLPPSSTVQEIGLRCVDKSSDAFFS